MVSVTKLILVPAEDWARLIKGRKDIDGLKSVEIQRHAQHGGGGVKMEEEPTTTTTTTTEGGGGGGGGGGGSSSLPPSPPPPPLDGGEGEGGEKGEYVEREDTGKMKSGKGARRDAGVWRPPGTPVSRRKRKINWIHI